MKPLLVPSVTMSDDYGVITVQLTAKTGQNQKVYSANRVVANGTSSENKQYATDNPIQVKELIINALYDVAEQYAVDLIQ